MNIENTFADIEKLSENDMEALSKLDARGLLLAPDETIESYKRRLATLRDHLMEIHSELEANGFLPLFSAIVLEKRSRIPHDILMEATEIDEKFYGFSIDWVPGFLLSKSLGFLWGGCAISFPENHLSIFLIRAVFAKRRQWLFYRRDELLAHELCHVARMPIRDRSFEEMFAYRLSPSAFRRYIGNCLQHQRDAVFFIVPFFLLLAVQTAKHLIELPWLPILPFWILAGLYPLFLLMRNQFLRNKFFRAKRNLEVAGVESPLPLMFRLGREEIFEFASFAGEGGSRFVAQFGDEGVG